MELDELDSQIFVPRIRSDNLIPVLMQWSMIHIVWHSENEKKSSDAVVAMVHNEEPVN